MKKIQNLQQMKKARAIASMMYQLGLRNVGSWYLGRMHNESLPIERCAEYAEKIVMSGRARAFLDWARYAKNNYPVMNHSEQIRSSAKWGRESKKHLRGDL